MKIRMNKEHERKGKKKEWKYKVKNEWMKEVKKEMKEWWKERKKHNDIRKNDWMK